MGKARSGGRAWISQAGVQGSSQRGRKMLAGQAVEHRERKEPARHVIVVMPPERDRRIRTSDWRGA